MILHLLFELAYQNALDELRRATSGVAAAGAALIATGDVSRAEAGKLFALSRGERTAAFPARARSQAGVTDGVDDPSAEPTAPEDDPAHQPDDEDTDLGQ